MNAFEVVGAAVQGAIGFRQACAQIEALQGESPDSLKSLADGVLALSKPAAPQEDCHGNP